jgi:acetyl/propionyl-CoA carboxylase alpha subunit
MGPLERVKEVGNGVIQVEIDGRVETLYVAGPPHDRWVFWKGRVYRGDFREEAAARRETHGSIGMRILTAPMPATVVAVHVKPGDSVKKAQVLMLLEAMKMELPVRAPGDGVIAAIHSRAGELVDADAVLLEMR